MYLGTAAEALSLEHDVTILHQYDTLTNDYIAEFLDLDLSRVRFRMIPSLEGRAKIPATRNPVARFRSIAEEHADLSRDFDLFLGNFSFHVPSFNCSPRGVLVVDFPFKSYEWWHDFGQPPPHWTSPAGAAKRLYRWHLWRERFASYHRILTYSEFSRTWLRRRWFIESTVVYPPRPGWCDAGSQGINDSGRRKVRSR